MFDLQATFDTLNEWSGFLQNHLPVEHWPDPVLWAGVGTFVGVALAFWGARLLRTLYVLGFMVIGATIGVRIAGAGQVDKLVGLILGAGAGGLLGFGLFRWWVGLTTGLVAVLVLLAAGAPRLNAEFTGFSDYRNGVGTGDYTVSLRAHEEPKVQSSEQFRQYVSDFWLYVLDQRRAAFIKTAVGLGLVWLLGTTAGLLLPRLIAVLGTTLLGTLMLAVGSCIVLKTRWPGAWAGVAANRTWFLAGLAVLFVAALSYQVRARRAPVAVAAPAAPAAA